jgi:Uma2 family endonuclease
MATRDERRMTLEEFLELPEEKPYLEFEPDGTVVQKMFSLGRHSALQAGLLELINGFARPPDLAQAFPELRAIYGGAAYVPDVSVYRRVRIPRDVTGQVADVFTEPQDIAIEIVSPGQRVNSLIRRSVWYVDNGVHVALVVDPDDESVLDFRGGQATRVARGANVIDLVDVLPGFELTAEQVFSALRA